MRKTIAMITSEESFDNNYGAVLQGFALFHKIEEFGYNPVIIRYYGGEFSDGKTPAILHNIKTKVWKIKRWLLRSKEYRKTVKKYNRQIKARKLLFIQFQKETLNFWNKDRIGWRKLKSNYPDANAYVCGSDQIWNPYFKRGYNDPGYFLAFAPKTAKKISYAPSFGCSDLPITAQNDLGTLLEDFTAISVREKSGIDIVKKYAHRDAKLVLDPTMLLTSDEWKIIARKPSGIQDRYILCYRFANSKKTQSSIDNIAERMGLPVISLPLSDITLNDPYQFIFEAGPREFVGLIQNATLVCTDSFHATVFSILMKTPVCVFLRENYQGGNSMNSRIYSLLEMLGLEYLIQTEYDTCDRNLGCLKEDYLEAHRRLDSHRIESLAFLKNAIEG
ncbi:MAG: polysaccharide pyruvyl transferase family protein [Pelotomaculum sp.]|jgi:hypothetical protein